MTKSCVLVAVGLMNLLVRLVPKDMAANMPFLAGVALNAHTGAVTGAIALMAALLLAAAPTLRLPSVTSRSAAGLPPSYRCVLYYRPSSYR